MIEKVNKVLEGIIGLPLTRTTRAANMECLKFGTLYFIDKKGNSNNYGEYGLHIQCPWRLTNDNEIIVGSNDLYEQADGNAEYDENFDWDKINANLRDIKLESFIATTHFVKSAIADKFGGLEISFDNNILLTVFPVISSKNDNEFWRLILNKELTDNHYVSSSVGYY